MFSNIAFIFIVLLLILFVCSKTVKEGFLNDPVGSHNEYIESSQKKYNMLTNMINFAKHQSSSQEPICPV